MKRFSNRLRSARSLIISASLFVAAACSGATAAPSSPPASSTGTAVIPVEAAVMGRGDHPSFTVQAPPSWSTFDNSFVTNNTGGVVMGLSVWDVGRVPRNPCHWRGRLFDPGRTVDDLVSALAAQPMRHATTPSDVTLDGYRGRYLEWSVPSTMVVTGDADFKGCDLYPGTGARDFVSWFGNGEGERYEQVAGQVDRLWVLNVRGQRLLVDATYSPNTTQAQRQELSQIATSLRFETPAA